LIFSVIVLPRMAG